MHRITMAVAALVLIGTTALANHSWGPYHWARTSASFDLIVVNSTTSDWDPYVAQAIADWSGSGVLNMREDPNGSTDSRERRKCTPASGQVRVCNLDYGRNGWLGIAGISVDADDHILYGYTKLNDSYFSLSYYNKPNWKQSVTCQELGHDVGLGHQDENFDNQSLLSCMDYQDPPFEYPNAHDFAQLDDIYDHLDSYNTYDDQGGSNGDGGGTGDGGGCNSPPGKGCNKGDAPGNSGDIGWGMSLGRRGQHETFMRIDPDGTRHITHVTWAIGN